jgi:hypothetical protein
VRCSAPAPIHQFHPTAVQRLRPKRRLHTLQAQRLRSSTVHTPSTPPLLSACMHTRC